MCLDLNLPVALDNFPYVLASISAYKDAPAELENAFTVLVNKGKSIYIEKQQ
jgi:hypothetical protein